MQPVHNVVKSICEMDIHISSEIMRKKTCFRDYRENLCDCSYFVCTKTHADFKLKLLLLVSEFCFLCLSKNLRIEMCWSVG